MVSGSDMAAPIAAIVRSAKLASARHDAPHRSRLAAALAASPALATGGFDCRTAAGNIRLAS